MFGMKTTTLSFPNRSRSFDAVKERVRFWAYDGAIEISFFLEKDALLKLSPGMSATEAACLKVFDDALKQIQAVANRVYASGPKGSYTCTLSAENFV